MIEHIDASIIWPIVSKNYAKWSQILTRWKGVQLDTSSQTKKVHFLYLKSIWQILNCTKSPLRLGRYCSLIILFSVPSAMLLCKYSLIGFNLEEECFTVTTLTDVTLLGLLQATVRYPRGNYSTVNFRDQSQFVTLTSVSLLLLNVAGVLE